MAAALQPNTAGIRTETGQAPPTAAQPLPISVIVATLIAFLGLAVIQNSLLYMAVLAPVLIASRFTTARIPTGSWLVWALRLAAYIMIYLTTSQADQGYMRMFSQGTISGLGEAWGTEAVIQAWRQRPGGTPPGAALVPLSGMVMLSASMTSTSLEKHWFLPLDTEWLLPIYIVSLIFAVKDLQNLVPSGLPRTPARATGRIGRFVAIAAALLIGSAFEFTINANRQRLNELDTKAWRPPIPDAAGLSLAPQLSDTFGDGGSPLRVLRVVGDLSNDHLRGCTFDTYANGGWGPPITIRPFGPTTPTQIGSNRKGSRTRVHVLVDGLDVVVAPLDSAGIVPVADDDIEQANDSGGPMQISMPAPYAYDIVEPTSSGPAKLGPFQQPPTRDQRSLDLQVSSEVDVKVWAIAASILQEAERRTNDGRLNVDQKIEAVTDYLDSNHGYSLTYHPGDGDPISNFLLTPHSAAHCEYFASAAVILLRMMGVPTRYATGYYAHENGGPGTTIVRQRDSHAWAESWIDGQGWVTVDATPGGGLPSLLYPPTPLLSRIAEWMGDRVSDLRDWVGAFTMAQILGAITGTILLYALIRALVGRRRKTRTAAIAVRDEPVDEELRAMQRRFDALLTRSGYACPTAIPWQEHLETLPEEAHADAVERFVTLYNQARFGDARLSTATGAASEEATARDEAREALNLVEKEWITSK